MVQRLELLHIVAHGRLSRRSAAIDFQIRGDPRIPPFVRPRGHLSYAPFFHLRLGDFSTDLSFKHFPRFAYLTRIQVISNSHCVLRKRRYRGKEE